MDAGAAAALALPGPSSAGPSCSSRDPQQRVAEHPDQAPVLGETSRPREKTPCCASEHQRGALRKQISDFEEKYAKRREQILECRQSVLKAMWKVRHYWPVQEAIYKDLKNVAEDLLAIARPSAALPLRDPGPEEPSCSSRDLSQRNPEQPERNKSPEEEPALRKGGRTCECQNVLNQLSRSQSNYEKQKKETFLCKVGHLKVVCLIYRYFDSTQMKEFPHTEDILSSLKLVTVQIANLTL